MIVMNAETLDFLHNVNVFESEIGFIKCSPSSILIGNETGEFVNSPIIDGNNLF